MGACVLLPRSSLCFTHHTLPYRLRRQRVLAASNHAEQGPVPPWYMMVGMQSADLYHTCHPLTKTVLHIPGMPARLPAPPHQGSHPFSALSPLSSKAQS